MKEREAHEVIDWVIKVMYRMMVRPDKAAELLSKLIKARSAVTEAMKVAVKPEFNDLLDEVGEVMMEWMKNLGL